VSTATADLALEFFRHPVVAHVITGALGIAAHAGGGHGQLHTLVGHAGDSLEAISVGHAGLGSREMARAHHAAAHRLAHRVVSAGTLGHGDHRPVSRTADLEVLAAMGLALHHGAVGVTHAALHVLHVGRHYVLHHHGAFGVHGHVHLVGHGHTDEENDNEELHGG